MESIKGLDRQSSFFGYEAGFIGFTNAEDFNYKIFIERAKRHKLLYIYSKYEIINIQLTFVGENMTF